MAWQDDADAIARKVNARLMTPSEFDRVLADLVGRPGSPVAAVRVEIQCPPPLPSVTVGKPGVGDASDVETRSGDEHGAFRLRTELWWGESGNEVHEVARTALRRVVAAWWRGDERNEKSRLLSGQHAATQRALEETIRTWLAVGPVLFCAADIDNFKPLNDQLGLPAGDALIARLGALLVEGAPRDSLVVHRSGDEFCLILPATTPGQAINVLMVLREEAETMLRAGVDVDPMPGLSIGVATCTKPMGYAELENLAGKALKQHGQKRRGLVTVLRPDKPPPAEGVAPLDLHLLLALNLLADAEPFHDPLLDAASVLAERECEKKPDLKTLAVSLTAGLARFATGKGAAPPPPAIPIPPGSASRCCETR